jgi:hypothetical protein
MYQFIHIEAYARVSGKGKKGGHTIDTISAEADRVEGNFRHVPNPKKPIVLFGVGAKEAADFARNWAENSKDTSGRKLRKDGLCLLAGVVSYKNDGENWAKFRDDSIIWLKKTYGDRLKSVIEHTDETHPHIHFYVVPRAGERFETVHAGRAASLAAKAAGKLKGEQNTQYREAMRAFQDRFSTELGMAHGMTRIGPARRRLTRDQWRQEQKQAEFFANAKKQHSYIRAKARQEAKEEAAQLKKEAEKFGAQVGEFAKSALLSWHKPTKKEVEARENAQKELDEVRAEAQKAQKKLEERLKNEIANERKTLQAEIDKLKRINASYEEDAKRRKGPDFEINRRKGLTL